MKQWQKRTLIILNGLVGFYLIFVFCDTVVFTTNTTASDITVANQYVETENLPTPPNTFYHDGCTSFPDHLFGHDLTAACFSHDLGYWAGGTLKRKEQVDRALQSEVSKTGPLGPAIAFVMYYGVHYFGNNLVSHILGSNWGYGWNQ